MSPRVNRPRAARVLSAVAALFGLAALPAPTCLADDPPAPATSRIARLFRFGSPGNATAGANSTPHNHAHDKASGPANGAGAMPRPTHDDGLGGSGYVPPPTPIVPPSTPEIAQAGPGPRITPQPRVSRPPTESDPLVSRVAIGRSDGGGQFGMFLQVFADGTVLDSEGIHKVPADAMKGLNDALHQSELYRLKGHCGAPSTDFIEQAHVVVYDRTMGRLRATAFSYSGNPQGCDPSVKKLHAALDAIQARLGGAGTTATVVESTGPALAPPAGGPVLASPPTPVANPRPGGPVLGLSAP